jgi:hypothetical protein
MKEITLEMKVKALKLLGAEISIDNNRTYAKDGWLKEYIPGYYWHNVEKIQINWNLVIPLMQKIYISDKYTEVANFFDSTVLMVTDSTAEETFIQLCEFIPNE